MQRSTMAVIISVAFIVISMIVMILGAVISESEGKELAFGTQVQSMHVEETEKGTILLVFHDPFNVDCEDIQMDVFHEDGTAVNLTKTDCVKWNFSDIYLFKSERVDGGNYSYSANVAVKVYGAEGSVDEFMDAYATGNSIMGTGCCTCCVGLLAGIFGLGMVANNSRGGNQQVVVVSGQQPGQPGVLRAIPIETGSIQTIVPPENRSAQTTVVQPVFGQPEPEEVREPVDIDGDEVGADGAFWGNLNKD